MALCPPSNLNFWTFQWWYNFENPYWKVEFPSILWRTKFQALNKASKNLCCIKSYSERWSNESLLCFIWEQTARHILYHHRKRQWAIPLNSQVTDCFQAYMIVSINKQINGRFTVILRVVLNAPVKNIQAYSACSKLLIKNSWTFVRNQVHLPKCLKTI